MLLLWGGVNGSWQMHEGRTVRSHLLPMSMMVMLGFACCRASSSQLARWLNVSLLRYASNAEQGDRMWLQIVFFMLQLQFNFDLIPTYLVISYTNSAPAAPL